MEQCCLLTQPFLPQASRQFDQEGRKKFFTLDMNNILLEWVGQLLNHRQPNPSSLCSSLLKSFSLIFRRFPSSPLLLSLSVLFSLCLSLSVLMTCFSFPFYSLVSPTFVYVHPALIPLPLPFIVLSLFCSVFISHHLYLPHYFPPFYSSIPSVFLNIDFFSLLFLLSVLSCRSRSSLLRCVQTSTRTWRHLCRATKKPSSNAWRSSASTSRWVRLIFRGSEKSLHITFI